MGVNMSSRSETDYDPTMDDEALEREDNGLNTSVRANHSSPSDSDGYDFDDTADQTLNIMRLLRSTVAGRRLHEMSSDSDDDDPDYVAFRKLPSSSKIKPDTSRIDKNEIRLLTLNQPEFSQVTSLPVSIKSRSLGFQRKKRLTSNLLPCYQTRLERFKSKVFCGVFGRDGNIFVSACQDRMIRIYDTSGGTNFRLLQNFQARDVGWSVLDVALSPDGHHVIYSSWNNFLYQVRILDEAHCPTYKPGVIRDSKADTEEEQRLRRQGEDAHQVPLCLDPQENQHQFCIFSLKFSQDCSEILGGANDGRIYVYNRETNAQGLNIAAHHHSDVNAVCFVDETTHILASGSDDGLVKVWDRRELRETNPKPVGQLAGHRDGICYLDPRGDGRYLISNSKDQSIKLWDIRRFTPEKDAQKFLKEVRQLHWDYRWECVPKPMKGGQKVCEEDSSVMTYRGHSVLQTLIRAHFSPLHSTGQKYIYTGCASGRVVIYDLLTGEIVQDLCKHSACVRDVSWHPYYPTIISSSWDHTVNRWDHRADSDEEETEEEGEEDQDEYSSSCRRKNPKRTCRSRK